MAYELPEWAPTVQEVAVGIISRTKLPNDTNANTFTEETTPTEEQVDELIEQACKLMAPQLGEVAGELIEQVKILTAIRVRYMIEVSIFTEQVEAGISPYKSFWNEYCREKGEYELAARGLQPNSPSNIDSMQVGTEYPGYATGTY